MITKLGFILCGSYFCEKYSTHILKEIFSGTFFIKILKSESLRVPFNIALGVATTSILYHFIEIFIMEYGEFYFKYF